MADEKQAKKDKDAPLKEPDKKVPYGQLWRYATAWDKFLVFIALIAASGVGVSQPALMVVFGDMTDSFVDGGKFAICDPNGANFNESICALTMATMDAEDLANLNSTEFFDEQIKELMNQMTSNTIIFVALGLGTWVCGWIQGTVLMIVSTRLTNRLRIKYFASILRQDVGYFDLNSAAEMNTRLFDDIKKVSDGVGDKLGLAVQAVAQTFGGIIIGFVYGWKMSLVVLACTPALAATGYVFFVVTTKFSKSELDSYAKAGDVAEEVLSSIRTVTASGGQQEELERYTVNLENAKKTGIKKQTAIGFSIGLLYLVLFGCYGLSFWYGAKLVLEDNYTIGQVLSAFLAVVIGAFGISQAGQNAEYFASAQAAAYSIYQVIDRTPPIDTDSSEGEKLENFAGGIEFENVDFTYPARQEQQVLFGVSFTALPGQTVALCGQSGCGKSTCFQVLQRFYDVAKGSIKIDGVDIKKLNLAWFRENIGIVSQEPVLFDTSIRENIKMGRLDVTDEDIKTALIEANAYDFIQKLPQRLDTYVGEGGATLSGGQKQRVSIARALVRNPRILLLDEATSALDTESERLVQEALDKASQGRTTIVIAHRLSTIRNADVIVGFASGKVVEQGPHDELIKVEHGVYANLYNLQNFDNREADGVQTEKKVELERQNSIKSVKSNMSRKQSLTGEKEEEEPQEEVEEQSMNSIYGLNRPELCYNIVGSITALLVGAIQPLFGIIFAEILNAYGEYACAYDSDIEELVEEIGDNTTHPLYGASLAYFDADQCKGSAMMDFVVFWSMMFVVIGGANFFGYTFFAWLFGKSGEELTLRLRRESFRKYLQLEMAYFDDAFNSTGALTARLSSDAAKVQGAIGGNLGAMLQSVGALLCAFTIAFVFEWRITLVCLAFIPVLMISQALMMKVFMGEAADKDRQVFEDAGKCTTEATMNIRTVASLGREEHFVGKYRSQLDKPVQNAIKKAWLFGFLYGMSTGIIFFMYAGCFYFAAYLIENGLLPAERFDDIFKVLMALVFGAMTAGQAGSAAPNIGDAKLSASRILKLLNRQSVIDPEGEGGQQLDKVEGRINFIGINFTYPTRPDIAVLRGLDLTVEPGETVALVGQSGCGKSTLIQLVERFYDGTGGDVTLDGVPVNQLNVQWLRRQIGFVQQEPVLFNRSIRENILFGSGTGSPPKSSTKVQPVAYDQKQIAAACDEANAKNFIEELPKSYDTGCGKRGNQLSGGQKQRVAIARALIRQPKILLLDEATSALDTESEKIVQDALNKASSGRTVILIAHRLSTVINADKIAVIDNGVIVEIGKHDELIAKKGAYYSLVNSQM